MKRIIALILLVCLFFNFSGYHLFFFLRKLELKAEMKEMLRSSDLNKNTEQFIFALNNKNTNDVPEWEGDDEFRLNGEMYDVVEKRIEKDRIIIRCISDKKETSLLRDYEKANKDDFSNSSSKHKSGLLLKLADNLYIYSFIAVCFFYNIPSVKHLAVPFCTINSVSLDILIPPPKIA